MKFKINKQETNKEKYAKTKQNETQLHHKDDAIEFVWW